MRVLLINKFLYPRGGAETYILRVGEYLTKEGCDVQYFGMEDDQNVVGNSLNLVTSKVEFHHVSPDWITYPFRIIYSTEARDKLKLVLESFKPDIVHLNNINFQLTPAIIDEIYAHDIPIVWTAHDLQVLCPNHLMYDFKTNSPCEKCINGSKWNCAKNSCIHHSFLKSVIGSIEGSLYTKKGTYSLVDTFVCPSRFIKNKLEENPLYKGKCVFLQNFMEPMTPDPSLEKKDYVLYFGRLSEEKGLNMLMEAAKKLPDIHFVIAGTGPEEKICKGKNVEFVGFKTGKELRDLIQQAAFSVYPSVWYENCPLSVLESQSIGTPVVATPRGGIPELIEDGKTGILTEVNADALAKSINDLYHDKTKLQEMSAACINKQDQFMLIDEYCKSLGEIYVETIKKHHSRTDR